jgi:hypothetical protein
MDIGLWNSNLVLELVQMTCTAGLARMDSGAHNIYNLTLFLWKVLMVQSCDNDILEGLAIANPPQTQNPLFFNWRDWRL